MELGAEMRTELNNLLLQLVPGTSHLLAKEGFVALQVSRGIMQCKMTMSKLRISETSLQ